MKYEIISVAIARIGIMIIHILSKELIIFVIVVKSINFDAIEARIVILKTLMNSIMRPFSTPN